MSTQTEQVPARAAGVKHPEARRSRWLLVAALVAIGLAAAGAWYLAAGRKSKAAEHAAGGGGGPEGESGHVEAANVDVVRPAKGGMAHVSAMTGSVYPFESAELYAKVSGYLKTQSIEVEGVTVPVDIGLHVQKGQVLAVIEDPEILAEAERASADLEQARAQATQAEAHIETARADVKAAEAAVTQAQAEVGRDTAKRSETEKAYGRYKGLRSLSAVEQDVVDQRQDAFESAVAAESASKATVMSTQAQLKAAEAKVQQAIADRDAAKAAVDVSRAQLKKARALADYTNIRSPYTGVVTHRNYFPGDFVRSAAEGNSLPLLTVARNDVVRVVTKISDPDVPYADVGDPAIITLDALRGVKLRGKIARMAEAEDPTEKTMRVEIDLPNGPNDPSRGRIRPGMYGLATITLQPASDRLTIPSACLTDQVDDTRAHVYVIREGKAHLVAVSTGADNGIRVEIISGLSADDRVVVNPTAVAEGQAVTPVEEAKPAESVKAAH